MSSRRIDVFFYGFFMDQQLLEGKGIKPVDVRVASVSGFRLRIGSRAALVPAAGAHVHGILMQLSHAELDQLYSEPSVRVYRPEPVLAVDGKGSTVAALCYNLPEPPSPEEHNPDYAAKLRALAQRLGLPSEYVSSIG